MTEYKQYVIVPKKPKMSKGKIAAQVAHATFMALNEQFYLDYYGIKNIDEWQKQGMCVIVLQCKNTLELMHIRDYLDKQHIINGLCIDEGRTEVRPMTPTALATGVLTEDKFWMFEKFKLFK